MKPIDTYATIMYGQKVIVKVYPSYLPRQTRGRTVIPKTRHGGKVG